MKGLLSVFQSIEKIDNNEEREKAIKNISDNGFTALKELLDFSIKEKNSKWLNYSLRYGYGDGPGESNHLFSDIARNGSKDIREWTCINLGSIITETWHFEHENLVLILQDMHHIKAVKPLHEAVFTKPPYLDEVDDADALSRKAIWALGKLILPVIDLSIDAEASKAAYQILKDLEKDKNLVVSSRAKKQLDRFADNGITLE